MKFNIEFTINIRLFIMAYMMICFPILTFAQTASMDSLKRAKIEKEIGECLQIFNETNNYGSEIYTKKAEESLSKINRLTDQYEKLTKDTTIRVINFMVESLLAEAYSLQKDIESAFIHAQNAYDLYDPYGRIMCSTNSSFYTVMFGCDGILGIMRDMSTQSKEYQKALEYCQIINDSCISLNLDMEFVSSLVKQGYIHEQMGDYEKSIMCHVKAYEKRLLISDISKSPTVSNIFCKTLEAFRKWNNDRIVLSDNKTLNKQVTDFYNSFFYEFFHSQSRNFLENEDNKGQLKEIEQAYWEIILLMEDFKEYKTIFSYEDGIQDFYIHNYGENSINHADFLIKFHNIYNNYSDFLDSEWETEQIKNKANERLTHAISIWKNYFTQNPIEKTINAYKKIKDGQKTDEYVHLLNIIYSYLSYMRSLDSYYSSLGNYNAAQEAVLKHLHIEEQILEDADKTFSYQRLGYLSLYKGDIKNADAYFMKSLSVAEENSDTLNMAKSKLLLYETKSMYPHNFYEAERFLYNAYKLVEKAHSHSIEKSCILASVANLYKQKCLYDLAHRVMVESMTEKVCCGFPLTDIDYILEAEMLPYPLKDAVHLLGRIQKIADKNEEDSRIRRASELIAVHYIISQKDYEKGIWYYQKAARIASALKDSIGEAKNLAEIGTIYFILKKYKEAFSYMQKAEKIYPYLQYPEYVSLMAYLKNEDFIKTHLPLLFDSNSYEIKRNMLQTTTKGREWLIGLLSYDILKSMIYYYQDSDACANICADIAYNSTLLYKGLLQNTQEKVSELIANTDDENLKRQHLRLQTLTYNIQDETERIFTDKTKLQIEATNIERSILSCLSTKNFYSDLDITWENVCKQLNKNDVAIEFVEINNLEPLDRSAFYYGALILRKGYKHPIFVELDSKSVIDKNIETILRSFNNGTNISQSKWNNVSKQLYNSIWRKLEKHITPGDKIYFSAAGMLHQAPIEVLNDENGVMVNEKYHVYRLSSTRELCKKRKYELESVALFGGLIYDGKAQEQEKVDTTFAFHALSDSANRSGWNYLPSTAIEINNIASRLDSIGIHIIMREGLEGTEKTFRKLSGTKISVLHISTHGFYFQDKESQMQNYYTKKSMKYISPMQRTGLMMSSGQAAWLGTSSIKPDEDGVLLADEIASMDLTGTKLVVLSACQTGLGDVDKGGEGVFGIQRAFKLAGVNSILMTLGKVDDKATQLFMDCFYKNLASGLSTYESFNKAQHYVKNYEYEYNGYKMNYSNPKFWAPFILLDSIN